MEKKKILLVDDSRLITHIEESILGTGKYEFIKAGNAAEALEKVRLHRPDLVLLDIFLPDGTGTNVCRAIRNDDRLKKTSVIMITVCADEEARESCFHAGCNDYICKPIDPNELKYKVEKLTNIPLRIPYRILVKVAVPDKPPAQYILANSVNISENGMLLEMHSKLEVGSEISMTFFLTSKKDNIEVEGKVVREDADGFGDETGYGITFTDISEEDKRRIGELVQRRTYGQRKDDEMFFATDDGST